MAESHKRQNANLNEVVAKKDSTFFARWKETLLLSFACVITFFFFGVHDIYLANWKQFTFSVEDFFWQSVLTALLSSLLLSLLFACLRRRLFHWISALILGILLAGYLQGTFLNANLGHLSGEVAPDFSRYFFFNTLLWGVFCILPFVVLRFRRNIWKKVVVFLPLLIAGMQLVSLTISYLGVDLFQMKTKNQYLSTKGRFQVSAEENIFVFLLDRFDGQYVEEMQKADPAFFHALDGFTQFPNHTSLYCRTYPSVTYLLTGELAYFEEPAQDYFNRSYQSSPFLHALQANGYRTKLYLPYYYSYSDSQQLEAYAENVSSGERKRNAQSILQVMTHLAAYRYAPYCLKAGLWAPPTDFGYAAEQGDAEQPYTTDDTTLFAALKQEGLHLKEGRNFFFYHMQGGHEPFNMDEWGNEVSSRQTNPVMQTKGSLRIVFEYIARMKALGIYENATIVITGDHGKSDDYQRLNTAKTTGLFVKPSGAAQTSLRVSSAPVSHENFQATILKSAGLPSDGYGKSVFEIAEGDDVVRQFLYRVDILGTGTGYLEEFTITGDARDYKNWQKLREIPMKYPY